MNPRGGDSERDERRKASRTIGRKRPFEASGDEASESQMADSSRLKTSDSSGGESASRLSSSSASGADAFQQAAAAAIRRAEEQSTVSMGSSYGGPTMPSAETSFLASSTASEANNNSNSDASIAGMSALDRANALLASLAPSAATSFLASSSSTASESNHNNSNSDAHIAGISALERANAMAAPLARTVPASGIGTNFNPTRVAANPSSVLDQASLMAIGANTVSAANPAAPQMSNGVSPELMNQINLMQLLQNQSALQVQQAPSYQSLNPFLAQQQQPPDPLLTADPSIRLLLQRSLASSAMGDARRLQLASAAGLIPGDFASLPLPAASRPLGLQDIRAGAIANPTALALAGLRLPVRYKSPIQQIQGPILYSPADDDVLSNAQILLRKQIELFAADEDDVSAITPGRKKEIHFGQVGIRCIYCAHVPVHLRTKGAVYYPSKLKGVYQAAQNMNASHFCDACTNIDPFLKAELRANFEGKSTSGQGGKKYWAESVSLLGVVETEDKGLRFDYGKKSANKMGKSEGR